MVLGTAFAYEIRGENDLFVLRITNASLLYAEQFFYQATASRSSDCVLFLCTMVRKSFPIWR